MAGLEWHREIVESARLWPLGLHARLDRGIWQLLGASEELYREFRFCAQRLASDLKVPPGDCDPTDSLLYRLQRHGRHVQESETVTEHLVGEIKVETRETVAVISCLRDALIEYLNQEPCAAPNGNLKSTVPAQGVGQAAAAALNRKLEARNRICQSFAQLGITFDDWPAYVQAHHTCRQVSIVRKLPRGYSRPHHSIA